MQSKPSITVRNINSLKRTYDDANDSNSYIQQQQQPNNNLNNHNTNNNINSNNNSPANSYKKSKIILQTASTSVTRHQPSDKFNAFGNFMTASLLDLPETKALELIERFTNEIVRALIENTGTIMDRDK